MTATIEYIYVGDHQYLSREFTYKDKYGDKHTFSVADEAILEVIDEDDNVDVGIYGYISISFFIKTLLDDDQTFAEKLNEYIDMDL